MVLTIYRVKTSQKKKVFFDIEKGSADHLLGKTQKKISRVLKKVLPTIYRVKTIKFFFSNTEKDGVDHL